MPPPLRSSLYLSYHSYVLQVGPASVPTTGKTRVVMALLRWWVAGRGHGFLGIESRKNRKVNMSETYWKHVFLACNSCTAYRIAIVASSLIEIWTHSKLSATCADGASLAMPCAPPDALANLQPEPNGEIHTPCTFHQRNISSCGLYAQSCDLQ